ncbi:MAG TPA: tRNA (adenosine(37)-N6)-dimethylallyltransferase MiaA [Anaerolineales bacterium]
MAKDRPLVAIVGPTAVGKTEIALQLGERLDAELVSADSRLLYRGMDIGTAKPSLADLARVPHHLIDVADPDETWSLAVFQRAAAEAISQIHQRGRLPILVGGTGQYLRAILEGWAPPKLAPQPRLRAALAAWAAELGNEQIHSRLAALDPAAAGHIDPRNVRRTLRALEVTLASGRRFSEQRGHKPAPYRVLQIGLMRPRAELYARIDVRIQAMLAAGWVNEVKALLAKGYEPSLPSLSAIGYAQLNEYLRGKLTLEQAVAEIKQKTRLFVRRQAAWFKPGDARIHWFDAGSPRVVEEVEKAVNSFLSAKNIH